MFDYKETNAQYLLRRAGRKPNKLGPRDKSFTSFENQIYTRQNSDFNRAEKKSPQDGDPKEPEDLLEVPGKDLKTRKLDSTVKLVEQLKQFKNYEGPNKIENELEK